MSEKLLRIFQKRCFRRSDSLIRGSRVEEVDLLEKNQAMKELLKEKRENQSGGVERHCCC